MTTLLKMIFRFLEIIYFIIKFKLYKIFFFNKQNVFNLEINLKTCLEKLGPIFIKFGQILSTRNDFFSNKFIKELESLQTNVTPISINFFENHIKNLFKHNFLKKINKNPLASASISQIYTALSYNDNKIILKFLKPDIKKKIFIDLSILYIILLFIDFFIIKSKRLKLLDVISELRITLNKEIDFRHEASNISRARTNFYNNNKIYIPKIYWTFISNNILIIEYIDGINLLNYKKLFKEKINKNNLIFALFDMFYLQIFKYNFFHADLHPGNILISKNITNNIIIILIDFGIVGFINNTQKFYLAENILAFTQKDYLKIAYLHLNSNTIKTNININEIETSLRFIFDPILDKKLNDISLQHILPLILNLSNKFKLQIQPKMLLFQKTLLSLEGLCRQINSNINLWIINRKVIERIFLKDLFLNKMKNNLNYYLNKIHSHNNNNIYFTQCNNHIIIDVINIMLSTIILIYIFTYILLSTIMLILIYYYKLITFLM